MARINKWELDTCINPSGQSLLRSLQLLQQQPLSGTGWLTSATTIIKDNICLQRNILLKSDAKKKSWTDPPLWALNSLLGCYIVLVLCFRSEEIMVWSGWPPDEDSASQNGNGMAWHGINLARTLVTTSTSVKFLMDSDVEEGGHAWPSWNEPRSQRVSSLPSRISTLFGLQQHGSLLPHVANCNNFCEALFWALIWRLATGTVAGSGSMACTHWAIRRGTRPVNSALPLSCYKQTWPRLSTNPELCSSSKRT